MEQQAATEVAEPVESQPTEANSEQSIDELLAEFDQETAPEVSKPTPEPSPAESPAEVEELKARLAAIEQDKTEQENISAIKSLKVEGIESFDASDVYDWMRIQASRDPRIEKAYQQRTANPAGWSRVLESMGKQFVGKFSVPDAQLTADREAVNAAVRGQSNAPAPVTEPTNEELSAMSDAEIMRLAKGG